MKTKSFTLIELLVVIVIIGILAGVIIVSVSSSISKANIAKVKVFENSIQNELGANMVSRWKLDEIVGTTTTPDAWGSNTGTLGDGVTASTYPTSKEESECVTGKCMYFDGMDDYVAVNNANSLENFYNGMTVSAWINFTDEPSGHNGYGYIVHKNTSTNLGGAPFCLTAIYKKVSFVMYNDITSTSVSSILEYNDGNWHNVVGTFDENNIKLYIDSINVKSATSISYRSNEGYLSIGSSKYGPSFRPFNGSIDDVRIYNSALTTAQIKQEYIAGLNSLLANGNISKEEYNKRIENIGSNF